MREKTDVKVVVSSNHSIVYWMDIFHNNFVVKSVLFVGKTLKIQNKEAENAPFKKLSSFILIILDGVCTVAINVRITKRPSLLQLLRL